MRRGAENHARGRVLCSRAAFLSIHDSKKQNFGVGIQPSWAPRSCSVLPKLRGSAWDVVHKSNSNSNGNGISRGAAEPRRAALRVEIAVQCRAPLHPQLQKQNLGSAFSRYQRRGLEQSSAPLRPSAPLRENPLREELEAREPVARGAVREMTRCATSSDSGSSHRSASSSRHDRLHDAPAADVVRASVPGRRPRARSCSTRSSASASVSRGSASTRSARPKGSSCTSRRRRSTMAPASADDRRRRIRVRR